jgi:hypothetical protein
MKKNKLSFPHNLNVISFRNFSITWIRHKAIKGFHRNRNEDQIQHATIHLLNAKIHLELHWSIEWKIEVTATFPGKVSTKEETEISFNTRRLNRWMQTITWIKFEYRIKTKSNRCNSGPRYLQKRKRRSDSIRNKKIIEFNDSPELNWTIELNLETSPTAAPINKQMSEQDIGIQHAAINSLNAEFGQKMTHLN